MPDRDPLILSFSESREASGLRATRRVKRLGPQIRGYRKAGLPWSVIKQSLEAIGIKLSVQVMKNALQRSEDKSVAMPTLTMRAGGVESAFRHFPPRPKDY